MMQELREEARKVEMDAYLKPIITPTMPKPSDDLAGFATDYTKAKP